MMRRHSWTYLLSAAAAALVVAGVLTWFTPLGARLLRGPAAQPAPAAPEKPPLPKATAEMGAQPLKPRMEDGVPTYDLVLKKMLWDTGGGTWKEAYTVNGMVPGPMLRVNEGERIRIRVKNELDEPSSIHWHGMVLPPEQDGVAHLTQDPIEPGESFTYEFKPGPPGTHWYHSHFDGAKQVANGLYGPLIVVPKDPNHPTHPSKFDVEHLIMIGDAGLGLVINGKGFPYTPIMKVEKGQRVLMRMINTGTASHPMHLHGTTSAWWPKMATPLPSRWSGIPSTSPPVRPSTWRWWPTTRAPGSSTAIFCPTPRDRTGCSD
jgi:FtsP/CotA-like multicopper oxidase with cupredoxin domain